MGFFSGSKFSNFQRLCKESVNNKENISVHVVASTVEKVNKVLVEGLGGVVVEHAKLLFCCFLVCVSV